jgi:cell wall-associated NlpC family hydrolase
MNRRNVGLLPAPDRIAMREQRNTKTKKDERQRDRPDRERADRERPDRDRPRRDRPDRGDRQRGEGSGDRPMHGEAMGSPPHAGGKIEAFLNCLRQSVGGRYCTPAREPECTDCSGLVRRCYRQATERDITGDSHEMIKLGREVSRAEAQPGDLLFWDTMNGSEVRGGNPVSHVGVVSSGNRMINALNADMGIRESDLSSDYWTRQVTFHGARRLEF